MVQTSGTGFNNTWVKGPPVWRPAKKFNSISAKHTQFVGTWKIGAEYAVGSDRIPRLWPEEKSKFKVGDTLSKYRLDKEIASYMDNGITLGRDYKLKWTALHLNMVPITGNETDEDWNAAANRSRKSRGEDPKPAGRGDKKKRKKEDKKVDATFINAENWAVKSNAPMLAENYPSREFMELQTDPYSRWEVKARDSQSRDAKKQTKKRRRRVREVQGSLPSDKQRLGYLEQDIFINSDLPGVKAVKSKKKQKQDEKTDAGFRYQFKFHYNPSTVNVEQGYSQEMDPLFVKRDPFTSTQTNAAVSFSLFINRIEEMQILNSDGSIRGGQSSQIDLSYIKWGWRNRVSQQTRAAIRQKGTMYDLEYLFRACNGEAVETWRGTTADYGILFAQPLRLHLSGISAPGGGNMGISYYGYISGISISHKMFSMDMVPSFTEVSLNFTRLPDTMQNSESDIKKAFAR